MDERARIGFDPVEFPHRYADPRDIEVSALLAAALAYGRADLFRPKVDSLLQRMGPSPAAFVRTLKVEGARALLEGFVYRFNVGTDVAVLLLGMGRALREHGSLEAVFARGLEARGTLHGALDVFTTTLRQVPLEPLRAKLGPERGLHHLLPSPLGAGAAKRLNLYLRWMVRGPDAVDFGIWKRVPPASLVIPLDTHIGRMAQHLGLTARTDLTWRTAEEVTAALRQIDPVDPVRFDFALCHFGMSGACPAQLEASRCARCSLLSVCQVGPKLAARPGRRA
ncbi:TIGR02757 family protein [Corallococcus sp. M34]|uniref:TIGR02757 family protein n=1 Tax=Citreicoccus inhibens TaxID=2849499 RepID=UPI0018F29162|nr:TIGR02757 family protein [Citreicoccus inhibens]MBU8899980.1 TIGR02757 family protein [Citreicoccus inhibens]